MQCKSSPRERGSSGHLVDHAGEWAVVPARAGVILQTVPTLLQETCRPRASGGHPPALVWAQLESGSSPRERGSSPPAVGIVADDWVVPARAGVIRSAPRSPTAGSGRPRASGGHPVRGEDFLEGEVSSPRERGSSGSPDEPAPRALVVPARAGVIPARPGRRWRRGCRPRASGGHPSGATGTSSRPTSSPRERGSSHGQPRHGPRDDVVPARAGVILGPDTAPTQGSGRPRASGGHPPCRRPAGRP